MLKLPGWRSSPSGSPSSSPSPSQPSSFVHLPLWNPSPPSSHSSSASSPSHMSCLRAIRDSKLLNKVRPRRMLSLRAIVVIIVVLAALWYLAWDTIAVAVPERASEYLATHEYWLPHTHKDAPYPIVVPGLLMAPWTGSFRAPDLVPPSSISSLSVSSAVSHANRTGETPAIPQTRETPAFLMLHIFSMPTARSAARRALIRAYSPLRAVPVGYKHLVEVKFVMGHTRAQHGWMSEEELQKEMAEHGDILPLDGLKHGENMNEGKTLDWIQAVGRGSRKAQWMWKCDDDTVFLLPNLLAELEKHDPSVPSYIGSSLGRGPQYNMHFLGMAYGFSWPVVATLGAANISRAIIEDEMNEDVRMGEIMFSLPSKPDQPDLAATYPCLKTDTCTDDELTTVIAPDIYAWTKSQRQDYPRPPDPRTGLHYINLLNRLVQLKPWPKILGLGTRSVIAWHGLKRGEDYVAAYKEAERGFKRRGRSYEWAVPPQFKHLYDPSEALSEAS